MNSTLISKEELLQRFPQAGEPSVIEDFLEMAEEDVLLFEGNVALGDKYIGALMPDREPDNGFVLLFDGDLTLDRLDWGDDSKGHLLFCTGTLTVGQIYFGDTGVVLVGGDLKAEHIYLHHGDNGGILTVKGNLKASNMLVTTYFLADVDGRLEVEHLFVDSTYASDVAKGHDAINIDEDFEMFVEAVRDGEEIDEDALFMALCRGDEVFLPR